MATTFIDSDDLRVNNQKAILVGIYLPTTEPLPEAEPLDELAQLAETAGITPIGRVIQYVDAINPATYCGKGKAEEIAQLCKEHGATMVIFEPELRPKQQSNLGQVTGARVMDRTELILLIFAEHARSHQSRIAVDVARLEYQLPRLKNLWSHLERQRGGLGKLAGAGERQIETDRRLIRNRIQRLKSELSDIERRRNVEVSRRQDLFQIALVGYTNAGKSTLMKALTGADVYIADQLFATLDTRTRVWDFDDHKVLLSDTVGFIRHLPHSLVASFHATLEEALQADLLLHVVDASHPASDLMIEAVNEVLTELGAEHKLVLLVLNKADRIREATQRRLVEESNPDGVLISAVSGAGLSELRERIGKILEERERLLELHIHQGNGRLVAFLNENCRVLEQRYEDGEVFMKVLSEPRWLKRISELEQAMPLVSSESTEQ